MLRRLAFCGHEGCGEPLYSVVRHGKRIYACKAQMRATGTCDARPIPADIAEQQVLDHLSLFVGDLQGWIGEQLAQRTDERDELEHALEARGRALASLDALRERRMAELTEVGITAIGLEVIERIDADRDGAATAVEDIEARLGEWTAPTTDTVLAYYERLIEFIRGKVAKADGTAAINAALHDALVGVWMSYDGADLHAEVRVRPSDIPEYDALVAALYGTLSTRDEVNDLLGQLDDSEAICRESTPARSSTPSAHATSRPSPPPPG